MNPLKLVWHRLGRVYVDRACHLDQSQPPRKNERSIEFRFLFDSIVRTNPGRVLDVGSGTTALPALLANCGLDVTAIDNVRDYWPEGMFNRHWTVVDDDITKSRMNKQYDMISCISVIEHIVDHRSAMREMFRLTRPGGHIVLTTYWHPSRYSENVYERPDSGYGRGNPYVAQAFSPAELRQWLGDSGGTVVHQEIWRLFTGEYWTEGERVFPDCPSEDGQGQHTCILIQKNI